MPDIEDIFKPDERRAFLVDKLNKADKGTFDAGDIAKPLDPFRDRIPNESLQEYRQLEFMYYESILNGRYIEYLSKIEKEMLKKFNYGAMPTVSNLAIGGWFNLPEEIIQFDLYDIQSNAAYRELLEIGIPVDANAIQMASYLESSAWRTAGHSAARLSGTVDESVAKLINEGMQLHVQAPGFGRSDFIKLLSQPIDGKPAPLSEARARTIARTEATRARNTATEDLAQALKSQGYQVVEIWRIAQNTNVCADCEALDGTVRGTSWTAYPPLHPNCDCDVELELLEVRGE